MKRFEAMLNLKCSKLRINAFIFVVFASLLAGCEGTLDSARHRSAALPETAADSLDGDALVYGRIRWIENGKERTKYRSTVGWNIWPKFLRTEDQQKGSLGVEIDGIFTWKLSRGTYVLQKIAWWDAWDGPHNLDPNVAFRIPSGAHAVCLGALVINVNTKRDVFGSLWIKYSKTHIEDDCGHMASQFRSRYADPNLKHVKSLMVPSSSIF